VSKKPNIINRNRTHRVRSPTCMYEGGEHQISSTEQPTSGKVTYAWGRRTPNIINRTAHIG